MKKSKKKHAHIHVKGNGQSSRTLAYADITHLAYNKIGYGGRKFMGLGKQ